MNKKIIYTDTSDSVLYDYLKDISKYKILTQSEINDLCIKYKNGDNSAKDIIVKANLKFVVSIAKQFQNRGIPLMDLISEGNIGLMKAVDKYDPEKNVLFLSYAVWWIKQCIYNDIYKHGKDIRLPMSQQLIVNTIVDTTNEFLKTHNREPSSIEISEITGIPSEQIDFLAQYSNKVISIDDPIGDEEGNQVCDIIPDSNESLDSILNKEYVSKELENILNRLTIRERDLICMLYGIGISKIHPEKITRMFGVGKERIRQMKEKTLLRLRKKFGNILIDLY